ncbi:hypothetical protein DOTSEDRAFT_25055 [Dothistroma septosporum NZE10]|uniref:Uncharacterized protein n=1 Tax=Dothistroma septosporum (strain NZE10 / CBS 128990) TaxID=675120 RepID=M2WM02_DOTSN|nr:hypothetical protein DOTSEDRAFT_25055 [Dothistroma septosporum NZE10]
MDEVLREEEQGEVRMQDSFMGADEEHDSSGDEAVTMDHSGLGYASPIRGDDDEDEEEEEEEEEEEKMEHGILGDEQDLIIGLDEAEGFEPMPRNKRGRRDG